MLLKSNISHKSYLFWAGFVLNPSSLEPAVIWLGLKCCQYSRYPSRRKETFLMSGDFNPDQSRSPPSAVYNISPHSSPWQPGEILTAHRAVKLLPFVWSYFKPTCVGFPTAGSKTTLLPWRRLLHSPTTATNKRRLKCYATGWFLQKCEDAI